MANARRVELSDILGRLPEIQPFHPLSGSSYGPDELFLCALGFEPRCLTIPRLLADNGYRSERAVFFEYDTNVDDNDRNRQELTEYLHTISDSVQSLALGASTFPHDLRVILESLSAATVETTPRITFDVSAAANRIVVTSMAMLCEADGALTVLYSEAATYHPTQSQYEAQPQAWRDEALLGLERGVSDVRPSREMPGQHFDPLPDAIVLFPTFKPERSQAVIDFVDPSLIGTRGEAIVWLVGVPHLSQNGWRVNALKEINGLDDEDVQYEVSTLRYQDTLSTLDTLHDKLSNHYKLTLSPIGSKMQALGSSLFAFIHPDTRIVFAIPKEYNASQFSNGCRETWMIEFGSLFDLRTLLMSVGELVIDE